MANLCDKIKEGIKKNQEQLDIFYKWIPVAVNNYVKNVKENKQVRGVGIRFDVNEVWLVTFTKKPLKKHAKEYNKITNIYADSLYSTETRALGNGLLPNITALNHDITNNSMDVYRDYIQLYKRKK